jgi:phosphopantetheine adenylyltransferase
MEMEYGTIMWNNKSKRGLISIFAGRFDVPHIGHLKTYNNAKEKFGHCYIAVSKTETCLTVDEKVFLLEKLGVDKKDIVPVNVPYKPNEILDHYDDTKTTCIYVIGNKDFGRIDVENKKDGTAKYFQNYDENIELNSIDKHSYIYYSPTFNFKINGKTIKSSTQLKAFFKIYTEQKTKNILNELYNDETDRIYSILKERLLNGKK